MSATFTSGTVTSNTAPPHGYTDTTGGAIVVQSGATVQSTLAGGGRALNLTTGYYTVSVDGIVFASGANGRGLFLDAAAPGGLHRVTVGASGQVAAAMVGVVAYEDLQATVRGTVTGGDNGVRALGESLNLRVEAGGSVTATAGIGVQSDALSTDVSTIFNAGTIEGTTAAMALYGRCNVTSSGMIIGDVSINGDGLFRNTGVVNGSFWNGGQAYRVINTGSIDTGPGGTIEMGGGLDTLTNSGQITADVDMGDGADTVKNSGSIDGEVDMGAGDDRYTGGAAVDRVLDAAGADTYKLGAGDDDFEAFSGGVAAGDGLDTVDGGAGFDTYDAGGASFVIVNLGTTAGSSLVFGGSFAARTATGTEIGTDQIRNFEQVWGTSFSDILIGGKAGDWLYGWGGADEIQGGAGDDQILGGNGADLLHGGLGQDTVHCGGADGAVDTIVFLSTAESPSADGQRDMITGFEGATIAGGDVIDLSRIDANRATSGVNDAFSFIGTAAFSGVAGELRAVTINGSAFVQADTDGDGDADFAVLVYDVPVVAVGDFVL